MRNRWLSHLKHIIVLLLIFTMIIPITGCKKEDPPLNEQSMVAMDANDVITQLANAEADYGYENALSELTEKSASTIDGDSYYRLQQNYQGIPVYGRTVVCATDREGKVTSLTGNAVDINTSISLIPTITLEQATKSLDNYVAENFGHNATNLQIDSLEDSALCIYTTNGNRNSRLAYCLNLGCFEILIDANNADILSVTQTVFEETESATGYTASDTNRSNGFSIEKRGDSYFVMHDISRGLAVFTFNGQISQDNTGFHQNLATIVASTDEVFGNSEEEIALECEKGAQLLHNVAAIHDYFASLGFSATASDTNLYYNDGYDSGENALGGKVDGYGVISMGTVTGVNCIDAIAHEYTHFVSRELVGWVGKSENGALNEAISDIFGEILESSVSGNEINWMMDKYRNIAQPNALNNPHFYKGNNWGDTSNPTKDNDQGYVHNNSTVISHAAYLMWNGIDGINSKKISTDDLAKLWYRTMLMMPSDCNFSDCRQLVELAATSMELTTEQIECVSEAFDAVGVTKTTKESYNALYDLALDSTLSVHGGDGELYDNYTLTISGNTTIYGPVIEKVDSSYNRTRTITTAEPYELDLPQGIYAFTITDNANPRATSTFTVCVWDDDGDANLDIFTNFGCTPVKGTVSEIKEVDGVETNVPIANAVVMVYSHSQESVVETINMAETEGFFEIYLPVGNYSFTVEAEGYISSTTSFELTSEESQYLEITLSPDSQKQLTQINEYEESGELYASHEYIYNENGALICTTTTYDDHEESWTYAYDAKGQLIEVDGPIGFGIEKYTYNDKGQIIKADLAYGCRDYEYNEEGKLIKTKEEYDWQTYVTEYTYGENGNLSEKTQYIYPVGAMHDNATLTKSDAEIVTFNYDYDDQDRLIAERWGDADGATHCITHDYSYMPFEIVTQLRNEQVVSVTAVIRDQNGNSLESLYLSQDSVIQVGANKFDSVPATQPEFFADKDGYLAKAIGYAKNSKGDIEKHIFEFCYDGASSNGISLEDQQLSSSNEDLIHISEEEAYQIACDYWDYSEGDISSETGFEMYVVPEYGDALREDAKTGKYYYCYLLRWRVVDENGYSWMSTCDIIHIDAETGECTYFS